MKDPNASTLVNHRLVEEMRARSAADPPESGDCMAVIVNDIRQDCDMGVWDNAFLHAEAHPTKYLNDDTSEAFANGANWMTGWIFGLLGMAAAIREYHPCAAGLHNWGLPCIGGFCQCEDCGVNE